MIDELSHYTRIKVQTKGQVSGVTGVYITLNRDINAHSKQSYSHMLTYVTEQNGDVQHRLVFQCDSSISWESSLWLHSHSWQKWSKLDFFC